MYLLSDIFLGEFSIAEKFGSNTPNWNARYNLQGCPGIVWEMPSLTPLLAGAEGHVLETGFEEAGKGKYVILQHDGFQATYGHLNDILVQKDERVIQGQLIGHSNQSGLADYPCLLFIVVPVDHAGNKTENNGYGGAIDPLGDLVKWDIKKLTEPVVKADVEEKVSLKLEEYTNLAAQAANFRVIAAYLLGNGFNEWMKENGRAPINLEANPGDNTTGQSVVVWLRDLADQFDRLEDNSKKVHTTKEEVIRKVENKAKGFFSFFHLFK